mmetsp:Transcript_37331/g.76548  ORF Transcript_37331/g.76548 Transcript_37331/m.76548 type:complete len:243 (-) Transcript_37331:322-1050(-)
MAKICLMPGRGLAPSSVGERFRVRRSPSSSPSTSFPVAWSAPMKSHAAAVTSAGEEESEAVVPREEEIEVTACETESGEGESSGGVIAAADSGEEEQEDVVGAAACAALRFRINWIAFSRIVFLSDLPDSGSKCLSSSKSFLANIRRRCSTSLWLSFEPPSPKSCISNIKSSFPSSSFPSSSMKSKDWRLPRSMPFRLLIISMADTKILFLSQRLSRLPGSSSRSSSKYCFAFSRRCCSTCL